MFESGAILCHIAGQCAAAASLGTPAYAQETPASAPPALAARVCGCTRCCRAAPACGSDPLCNLLCLAAPPPACRHARPRAQPAAAGAVPARRGAVLAVLPNREPLSRVELADWERRRARGSVPCLRAHVSPRCDSQPLTQGPPQLLLPASLPRPQSTLVPIAQQVAVPLVLGAPSLKSQMEKNVEDLRRFLVRQSKLAEHCGAGWPAACCCCLCFRFRCCCCC